MEKNKKIIFITGTPCVGKTTIATSLNKELNKKFHSKLFKLNEIAIEHDLIEGEDIEKRYKVVDIDRLNKKLFEIVRCDINLEIAIVEGHLSHLCDECDKIIVLRLNPNILKERLINRKYSESKIQENLEAEALAVCSVEAFEKHGKIVNEIDTTNMSIMKIVKSSLDIIENNKNFPIGNVDFMEWLIK